MKARPSTARRLAALGVLAATGALTVVFVSSGGKGSASAETSLAQYVPIEQIAPNVVVAKPQRGAAEGRFTVDCGTNRNGKFSPDNPVAQPGIKNGAEHVHDFVGNQAITADTPDEVLAKSETTCANGDRSSYFWPVVRIDESVRAEAGPVTGDAEPTVSCPDVAGLLPVVPASAEARVRDLMSRLDQLTAAAQAKLGGNGRIDPRRNNAVLATLRTERAGVIRQIGRAMARGGARPAGLVSAVECEIDYEGLHAGHTTAAEAAASGTTPTVSCPDVKDKVAGVPDAPPRSSGSGPPSRGGPRRRPAWRPSPAAP